MFILSCSAALAFGLFPFAAGQSVASGDRGKMETAPRPGLECLQVTLLIRQMVLDRYDTTGTGILSEQDKARLVEDARSARREARKAASIKPGCFSRTSAEITSKEASRLAAIEIVSPGERRFPR